jgi:hypothetical protein
MSRSLTIVLLIFLFIVTIIVTLIPILDFNDGLFMYTFDDAFIHMAYCKNIVLNGLWGITPYEFSSTTSSPLWTVMLAGAFYFFGVSDYTLLIFNFVISILLIISIASMMNRLKINSYFILIVAAFIILLAPFSIHAYSGMEHLLHSLLSLAFIFLSSQILSSPEKSGNNHPSEKKLFIFLILLSPLLAGVRYEGLMLIGLVAFISVLRGKNLFAFIIVLAGLIPVVLYGIHSMSNGSYFLPNTVMIKSRLSLFFSDGYLFDFFEWLYFGFLKGYKVSLLFFPSIALWIYCLRKRGFWNMYSLLLFFFIGITLLQAIFGMIQYWRYELNHIITGIFVLSVTVYSIFSADNFNFVRKRKKLVIIFTVLFCLGVVFQGIRYFKKTAMSSRNIYEQQYQMSMFLKEYYTGESIAANDIGAMNYYTNLKCLDLVGLGSLEIAKVKINNTYSKQKVKEIAEQKNVKIALVYDSWFGDIGGLPGEWIKVGEWKVQDKYILGSDVVSFYAVDPSEAGTLRSNLKSFYPRLPSRVGVSGEIK